MAVSTSIQQRVIMKLISLLLFMSVSEGFNIAHIRLQPDEGRWRRETPLDIIEIKYFRQDHVELVVLHRVLDTTLEPNYLPIVSIDEIDEETGDQQLLGIDPVFYHGLNSYSAITYFPHSNTLHGVIDHAFFIENLPMKDARNPEDVSAFIHSMSSTASDDMEKLGSSRRKDQPQNKRKLAPDMESIPKKKLKKETCKHVASDVLYPEILLAVDISSRVDDMKSGLERYDNVIMYVLSYWNAVDMLFRQLKFTKIKISITGIIVGKTEEFVDDVINDGDYSVEDSQVIVPKEDALEKLGNYFYQQTKFKRNSFDFLVWMTRAQLINGYNAHQVHGNLGIAAPSTQCGGLHYDEMITRLISNRAIVMHDDHYADYHLAARELAHLMFVADDDVEISSGGHQSNCMPPNLFSQTSGIMDPTTKKIDGCVMWSYCSEMHFERYANSISSCCLLNYPYRTMIRPKTPIQTLTVAKQCQCCEMQTYSQGCKSDICRRNLKCRSSDNECIEVAPILDGTQCVEENDEHICIDNVCV